MSWLITKKLIEGTNMQKLQTMETPSALEVFMAKSKFKLDGVRYRGKLKAHQWNRYEANL
jgi:hypothetical protein